MKKILGLDLGTNSIGWAIVSIDENNNITPQIKLGSRIIPMSQDVLGKFDSGVTESQTAKRTEFRSVRRLRERCLLRRERLLRVLHTLDFLPLHFDNSIGWNKDDNKTYGKFIDDSEPKIAWRKNDSGKMEFVFMDSFHEMLNDFKLHQPQLVENGKSVPLDWCIYYLRKKALTQAVTKQELAWILLNFNQKRGYYQLRGEEESNETSKKEEYYELKVVKVEATGEKRGNDVWYNITLENGWVYKRCSKTSLNDLEGKTKAFIVTTDYNDDGTIKIDKDGNERRSFRSPKEEDWALQKKRIETSIESSGKSVGEFIYDVLLSMPSEKIRGKLVRTIERKYYKQELEQILNKQKEYIPELTNSSLYTDCIKELYARNTSRQDLLRKKDLCYMLIEDILFYQRPLKSKKSLIANCPYEQYEYVNRETGEIKTQYIKCIAKSNPYYQEFRLWQFITNLRLYSKEEALDVEVTKKYLTSEEDYVNLYYFLNNRKDITQDALLRDFFKIKKPKGKDSTYPLRWNYVEDKSYPCNETRYLLMNALKNTCIPSSVIEEKENEYQLWHLLYSVNDRNELIKGLTSFAVKHSLPVEDFVDSLRKIPSFKKEYGAYSEKATKKLLSVMRMGALWSEDAIPESCKHIVNGEVDDNMKSRILSSGLSLGSAQELRGLPVWLACYVVYGRHSEATDIQTWQSPKDLAQYIRNFKQYSLRNPIVEQCILETLRTVYDIWIAEGHIEEIHIELGRSMKSTAEQRRRISERNITNENTNLRIKSLLRELKNDDAIEGVRPYSPMQQEILRIYEEGALQELNREDSEYNDILKISSMAEPSRNELIKYKLWLEQKYRSPYTGKTISLSKLFTPAYEIEHIIPQSRYFDDSLSNKVICESEVNKLKTNLLGFEFIKKHGGQIVTCPLIGDVKVFTEYEYKKFISEHYTGNRTKAKKLMLEDIPDDFIQRQMNDSRYISKVVKGLLSNVVREKDEVEAISKNVITCTGGITDKLKNDWGLNDIWNRIISPRFERMNQLTSSNNFGHWEDKNGKRVFQTMIPIELQRGFSKKRIDHRHHAMDALVIALASRNIVNYLNNESANDTNRREDLRHMLCEKNRVIRKPWDTFTQDTFEALQQIVVSFKHYTRIVNKATNYYERIDDNGRKTKVKQQSSEQWAIRQSLHDQFVFGHVNLRRKREVSLKQALKEPHNIVDKKLRRLVISIMALEKKFANIEAAIKATGYQNINNIEVYYLTDSAKPLSARRRQIDTTFNEKKIKEITDTGIQTILLNYLHSRGGDPKVAFTPEGIAEMNENISEYNRGKQHQPIRSVRVCEALGSKIPVGYSKNKNKKFVQGAAHLFLGIYVKEDGDRLYYTVPLNEVIERQKQGLIPVPEKYKEANLLFWLSPNDLVYVPTEDEKQSPDVTIDKSRIYRFISSEGSTVYFLPLSVSSLIMKKCEFESLDKSEKAISISMAQQDNLQTIKTVCWKLEIDRLGNITKIIR